MDIDPRGQIQRSGCRTSRYRISGTWVCPKCNTFRWSYSTARRLCTGHSNAWQHAIRNAEERAIHTHIRIPQTRDPVSRICEECIFIDGIISRDDDTSVSHDLRSDDPRIQHPGICHMIMWSVCTSGIPLLLLACWYYHAIPLLYSCTAVA